MLFMVSHFLSFQLQVDPDTHQLAKYLMELTITEYSMVHYKPSEIAAGALALAMRVLDNGEWVSQVHLFAKG